MAHVLLIIQKHIQFAGSSPVYAPKGSYIALVSGFDHDTVSFEPVRGMATEHGTLTVQSPNFSAILSVNRLGRISVCSATLKEYKACA